jgi:hypothetical protein
VHKSRIGGVFIDHPPSSFQASLEFWRAATGRPPPDQPSGDDTYQPVGLFEGQLLIELQRVGEETRPRVHLDVDTDDVEAEVRRLESLGATRLESYDDGRYWQMADPGGLVFCVIPPHTPDFEEQATTWP